MGIRYVKINRIDSAAYSEMKTIDEKIQGVNGIEGLELLDHFTLQVSDWSEYYDPLRERIQSLKEKYKEREDWLLELEAHQREIDIFEKYSDFYGYVFYIIKVL